MKNLGLSLVSFISLSAIAGPVESTVDSIHFEFSGVGQWDYQISKNGKVIRLEVPKASNATQKEILNARHASLVKVEVDPLTPQNRSVFLITLKDDATEVFDYLTDDPKRLIVDILPPKVAAKNPDVKKAPASVPFRDSKKLQSAPAVTRKPASDALILQTSEKAPEVAASLRTQVGIFDGSDPEFKRFSLADHDIKEEAKIKSQREVYIDFPMLRKPNSLLFDLLAKKPNFSIAPEDTEENKQARLLLTLYENKRRQVFNKTVEWFFEKYPGSDHEAAIRFMWADNLFQLWKETQNPEMFDLAMLRYRQAIEVTKNQEAIEWALLLMGFATLDRGDVVGTLRQFEYHLRTRPQSADRDVARLALAEAFAKLNQFDLSVQHYEEVEKNGLSQSLREMATFLKPDVYFLKKDYSKAIELYDAAIQKFPAASRDYPNAFFNKAAAYFGQRKFKESLKAHLDFLKNFPSHDHAGYAMTRVGEILEALGASQDQVLGAYLETYFRYGQSPSALVARLRLLAARMDTMKPKEVEKTIADLKELSKKSELTQVQQFLALMLSDGFSKRKEFQRAIDELVTYYQRNPTNSDSALITQRIVDHINSQLHTDVSSGRFIQALQWHEKYADTWLKNSDRIDMHFDLARAYELAGVQTQAHAIYQSVINRMLALGNSQEMKERQVFERLPSLGTLYLRLASTESNLEKWSEAYDHLREIKEPTALTPDEQIQRVQLMASLLEKKNELIPAERFLTDLIQTWKGVPHLVAEPYYQLGLIEMKQKKSKAAIESFSQVNNLMVDSGKVNPDTHARSLEKKAEAHLELREIAKAQETMDMLLSAYEASRPLASVRYKLGRLYFDQGEVQKASDVWKDLKGPQAAFWSKLAQEQLGHSNWSENNKRYLQRSPASANRSGT